jgi:cyclic lactone autoinducer peptide
VLSIIALLRKKLLTVLPALAMVLAIQSVSSTCFFLAHQPDIPKELEQIA